MAKEIERKFIVIGKFKHLAYAQKHIRQGYLKFGNNVARVRIAGNEGFITQKSKRDETGIRRDEWERKIDLETAEELIALCADQIIEKMRYYVKNGNHIIEVDEFYGDNEGLIIAEIELQQVDEPFEKPDWLGADVSLDHRYYNSRLIKNPYKNWGKDN